MLALFVTLSPFATKALWHVLRAAPFHQQTVASIDLLFSVYNYAVVYCYFCTHLCSAVFTVMFIVAQFLLLLFLIISLFALTVMYFHNFYFFLVFFSQTHCLQFTIFICAPFAAQMHCFCLSEVKGPCSCAGLAT